MILVDVVFPELDKIIDFQFDENIRGWDIAEEIMGMAAKSCGRDFSPEKTTVLLYSVDRSRQLDMDRTLKENGIHAGERLLVL